MRFPLLYQANIRLILNNLSEKLGRQATLDDFPDEELQELRRQGFDWLYLICLWETGQAEAKLANGYESLRAEARQKLGADKRTLCGSCFAISGYNVPGIWGSREALLRFKERLNRMGLKLMLDFIPNHVGISHPWGRSHPEYFITPDAEKTHQKPEDFYHIPGTSLIYAHGRDPYFPPWSDTLQLNYASPALQTAQQEELLKLSEVCDGLRCDMAMLALPEVFQRVWGLTAQPFWPEALAQVKAWRPDFVFLAEVYWGLEKELQTQGFDYTYDKTLYDRLRDGPAVRVSDQLRAEQGFIQRQAHFLENHDEPRAATVFPHEKHLAAAVISFTLPGLRFFFDGQLQGHKQHIPMQFCHAPTEQGDPYVDAFYARLMGVVKDISHQPGSFQLIEPHTLGNDQTFKNFLAFTWLDETGSRWLTAVNYAEWSGQCMLALTFPEMASERHVPRIQLEPLNNPPGALTQQDGALSLHLRPRGFLVFQFVEKER